MAVKKAKKDSFKKNKAVTDKRIVSENLKEKTTKLEQEDIFTDKTTIFEDLKEKIEKHLEKEDKNYQNIIILLIVIIFFLIMTYLFIPRIYLTDNKELNVNYNETYQESGYKAKFLFKDITKLVKVENNIKVGTVGKYKIKYYIDYGFIRFKRIRKINIIDNIEPIIEVDSDLIEACPNEKVENINYKAYDEYDGLISTKVTINYDFDLITLKVKDNSNNETVKEVTVTHSDTKAPVITLSGSDTIYLSTSATYKEPGYKASDNCDGDITDKVVVSGNALKRAGTYTLTYTVVDSSGNESSKTRTVKVYNGSLYNSGTIGNGTIYLTFDDGPSQGITNVILDILKEEGIKATFFVTSRGPDSLIKRMYDEGHTVALHTATHDYAYVYSSVDNYFADLKQVSDRVKRITGFESKIIRFPGGSSNTISRNYSYGIMSTLTSMVLDRGYRYFDWNVDSHDASSARSSGDVYRNVTNGLSKSKGNVVLMHDIKTISRDALRDIINYGKANGYVFAKIEMDTYMIRHSVNN